MATKPALFLHIQKTAGSTFVGLAKSIYGPENVASHGDFVVRHSHSYASHSENADKGVVGEQKMVGDHKIEVMSYASLAKMPFISGHFGFDYAKQFMADRYTFTFLRDPIDRILSFYYFCLTRDPSEFEIYSLAQRCSLDEFLELGLTHPSVKPFIWNNQTWQLANGFGTDTLNADPKEILALAIEHLDEFSHVGFAETFEHDRDHILRELGLPIPSGRIVANANPGHRSVRDLPRKTLNLLHKLTHLDRQLYQVAWLRWRDTLKYVQLTQRSIQLQSEGDSVELENMAGHYLDLLQSCLTGSIYLDASQAPFTSKTFDSQAREHGLDWPTHAHTMIGEKRLANLRHLTVSVLAKNVPGDFIETGVWRGGACILMRAVLSAYGETDRKVWVADSFQGLPTANVEQYPEDKDSDFHTYSELAISLEEVQSNFRSYGLLDDQVAFLKGWFKDTLPTAPVKQLALMRLDGDLYESTMDALTSLYPKLSENGYVIIDDYHVVPACKAAVHDYFRMKDIQPEIVDIDGVGVYWQKKEAAEFNSEVATRVLPKSSVDKLLLNLQQKTSILNQLLVTQLLRSLHELDGGFVKVNAALRHRDFEVVELRAGMARANAELQGVYASGSWKITKPLRFLRRMFASGSK